MLLKKCHISVVIPLLNEESNIQPLYDRLLPIVKAISDSYELIFVDDGSKDNSFAVIQKICKQNTNVLGISFSRNFGHQVAITAGLEHASGDVVITMDADLQHPPELITDMYKQSLNGFDIVNTIRTETADTGAFKNVTSRMFYNLINRMSDVEVRPGAADFRLMNRKTVDAFLQLKEKDRFTRGMISWMGYKQSYINYTAPKRHSGTSKYSFLKMLRFAVDGITSFSAKPLRVSFYAGLVVSLLGLIYAIYAIVQYFQGNTTPGWASTLISILVIGGIQLISIGIIGEYLARVFNESKNRPLYLVKEYTTQDEVVKNA